MFKYKLNRQRIAIAEACTRYNPLVSVSTAPQRVQEIMYRLRARIRGEEDGVGDGLSFATNAAGISLESLFGAEVRPTLLLDEALQSRCPEDGQNLLMFAAAQGNGAWFLRLIYEIRLRVSVSPSGKSLDLHSLYMRGSEHAHTCRVAVAGRREDVLYASKHWATRESPHGKRLGHVPHFRSERPAAGLPEL